MEISTFLLYKAFGRLTPNYESGFEDRKILNLKVNFICQKSKLESAFFHSINQGSDGEVAEKLKEFIMITTFFFALLIVRSYIEDNGLISCVQFHELPTRDNF